MTNNYFPQMCFISVDTRAGKSSKMYEHGLLSGIKCPQTYIGGSSQNCKLSLILPNFQPDPYPLKRILSLYPQHLQLK